MSPYRTASPSPVESGPRWGATPWRKFFVRYLLTAVQREGFRRVRDARRYHALMGALQSTIRARVEDLQAIVDGRVV